MGRTLTWALLLALALAPPRARAQVPSEKPCDPAIYDLRPVERSGLFAGGAAGSAALHLRGFDCCTEYGLALSAHLGHWLTPRLGVVARGDLHLGAEESPPLAGLLTLGLRLQASDTTWIDAGPAASWISRPNLESQGLGAVLGGGVELVTGRGVALEARLVLAAAAHDEGTLLLAGFLLGLGFE